MYIKPTAAIALLLPLQPLILTGEELPRRISHQSDPAITNKASAGEKSAMSDRDSAGLRGPVQQYTEEHTNPAVENFPAWTYSITNKYSPEGRILQSTTANSLESGRQEFSTTYTYDSMGRLLKKTSTNPDSPASESKYNCDENGRIISITGPMRTSTFEYDDKGRKSRIVSPSSESESLLPAGVAYEFSNPEEEDPYLPIPAGGHATILFNEQDQPVEWLVSDANGNLLNRLIRTYDEHSRLAELRYTMENILLTLPAEAQQQFLAEPGAAEQLAKQFAEFLGEQRNFMKVTYSYDADGRLTEKHTHMGPSMETIAKIAYNDHSDKSEEHTTTINDANPSGGAQSGQASSGAPPSPQKVETRYSYTYDNFGNWTEQRTSSPTCSNDVSVIRRTIVYY
jgi:YD repeat-containing protein